MNARRVFLVLVVCLAASAPSSAEAYEVSGSPWLQTTITYRADSAGAKAAADYAARKWNAAGVGVRFRGTRGPANVIVRLGGSECGGVASVGRARGAFVRIGPCERRFQALSAAHEFGHVIGLGHERRRCALMNPYLEAPSGTPARCNVRSLSFWVANPLRVDDIRGARAITRRARG